MLHNWKDLITLKQRMKEQWNGAVLGWALLGNTSQARDVHGVCLKRRQKKKRRRKASIQHCPLIYATTADS